MGAYCTITLKKEYCTPAKLQKINRDLMDNYGCPSVDTVEKYVFFSSDLFLDSLLNYLNYHPEGRKENEQIPRPISAEVLTKHPLYSQITRTGFIQIKLSGGMNRTESEIVTALAKWSQKNRRKIDLQNSDDFNLRTVRKYCVTE